ncbi:MAG: dihydrofolate reductase [Anaerolineales bacterium]
MIISIIVAMDENGGIGVNNRLPWHLPDDLKRFKSLTMGHHLIIGRKTFESIGKPLMGRKIIVLSRKSVKTIQDDIKVVSNLSDALQLAACENETEVFIGGGKEVFQSALPLTERMYLTLVHTITDADVFFPKIDWLSWEQIESEEHPIDEKHKYSFTYKTLQRTTPKI